VYALGRPESGVTLSNSIASRRSRVKTTIASLKGLPASLAYHISQADRIAVHIWGDESITSVIAYFVLAGSVTFSLE
jgi:hypothetical protein